MKNASVGRQAFQVGRCGRMENGGDRRLHNDIYQMATAQLWADLVVNTRPFAF